MRKLATVREVKEIRPIENADAIELAIVDGWQVVVKKGEFEQGDLGVYFEIDSFLPERKEFEFLRKSSFREMPDGSKGFRLRTIKLRGEMSQGLLLPTGLFPEIRDKTLGEEVTKELGVIKYDPPVPAQLAGEVKGRFPSFIRKTDEERIQNLISWFERYKHIDFEVTEKLDGSSMTVYFNDEESGVCSRNLDLKESETNTFWRVARELKILDGLEKFHQEFGKHLAIQGECVGPGLNGNSLKLSKQTIYVFNIFDIDEHRYMVPDERTKVLEELETLGCSLYQVPFIEDVKVFEKYQDVEKVLEMAEGKSLIDPGSIREGLVFKSKSLVGRDIISFKAINNEYLLKQERK